MPKRHFKALRGMALIVVLLSAGTAGANGRCDELAKVLAQVGSVGVAPKPFADVTLDSPLFDFEECKVFDDGGDGKLNCNYDVDLPQGAEAEELMKAQDLYMGDVARDIAECYPQQQLEASDMMEVKHYAASFFLHLSEGESFMVQLAGQVEPTGKAYVGIMEITHFVE